MNRHASMNRIYRLVWSQVRCAWVPVAEIARGRSKAGRRAASVGASSIAIVLSIASMPSVQASQGGGKVVSGDGSISQTGTTTTVQQSTQTLSLDWQSFNIATQETVDFVQPSSSAIAVNRVVGNSGSQIFGHLNANGQVYLINPNGVVFGKGAEVDVGGLVASTLDLNDASLAGSSRSFSGSTTAGVVNDGSISAKAGGFIALLGSHVSNQGQIVAKLGTIALGAGSGVTLTFKSNALVKMQVDASVLKSVAENGGLLRADGGTVVMTAGAQDALLASVVNNTGLVQARTLTAHDGTITLSGGGAQGVVDVGGTLDASAAAGGNGGQIATTAASVDVASGSKVTTAAVKGLYGSWFVGSEDLTVAANGGNISGATLSADLAKTSVTLQGGGGKTANVTIDDAVSWKANTHLTLSAPNDVDVNATLTALGSNAGLTLGPDTAAGSQAASGGGALRLANGVAINLPNVASSSSTALVIEGTSYTVINKLGTAGSTDGTDLQGITGNLSRHYALGSNIDAASSAAWNGGAGFTPIGTPTQPFTGTVEGLGHSVSSLTIKRPGANNVGLLGFIGPTAVVENLGMAGGTVVGGTYVGALVGTNYGGQVLTDHASTTVRGTSEVGGLVGFNQGQIGYSHATGRVTGSTDVGGLVGFVNGNYEEIGAISTSFATGSVSGSTNVGGLVGGNGGGYGGSIFNSRATGNVSGGGNVGGLVGYNGGGQTMYGVSFGNVGTIARSYATGDVTGTGQNVGGLVGFNQALVSTSHATGNVSGAGYVGGLVGYNGGWEGSYRSVDAAGGVNNSYATGSVRGSGSDVGGLVGFNGGGNGSYGTVGVVSASFASGAVHGAANVGGLVGFNSYDASVANSYARGSVTGSTAVGGLVGFNSGAGGSYGNVGDIATSYAAGKVSATGTAGGLVGAGAGTASASFWDTRVSGLTTSVGGIGMTTAQMQTQANFVGATAANGQANPGWDFANIWFIQGAHSYPLLIATP